MEPPYPEVRQAESDVEGDHARGRKRRLRPSAERGRDAAAVGLVANDDDGLIRSSSPPGDGREHVLGGRSRRKPLVGLRPDAESPGELVGRLACAKQRAREDGIRLDSLGGEPGGELSRLLPSGGRERAQLVGLAARGLGVSNQIEPHLLKNRPPARAPERQPVRRPVAYMTTIPARKPPTTQPSRPPGAVRATYRPTSTTTCSAAPTAIAKKSTPSRSSSEAADPGSGDRRRAGDQREAASRARHALPLLGHRGGDAEPLGHVVDHEADDQEGAQRELPERERGADREALAEVVQADADGDERAPGRRRRPRRRGRRERGGPRRSAAEVGGRDAEQHEAGAAERAGQRRLQVERLGERLDGEEGEQAGGQRHERGEPRRAARRSDGSQSSPSATGTTPTRRPISA